MKFNKLGHFLLVLLIFTNTVFGNVCDDHVSPIITFEDTEEILQTYNKSFIDLPNELQLAVKEGLLNEAQVTNYLSIQAKWDARGKLGAAFFKKSGLWRKTIENPKFLYDYASNLCSGAGTTVICHIPYLKANSLLDTPLLTVDILSGFITDSELSFISAKSPSYVKELKRRGLIKPGKIELANQKFNNILDKVKEIAFKRYLKKRKVVELASEETANQMIGKTNIPAKYLPELKKHIKEMSKLSFYFTTAGAINGVAYKGLQVAMGKVGFNLEDPYSGFSMWTEASYFAQFSVHAYTRIVLTDKIVGRARSMIDDVFEGMKQSYLENPKGQMLDPNRIAMYDTLKYFFLGAGTIGIYFASNLWATDVYMRWREENFDNTILIFPYQKELKEATDQIGSNLASIESDAKEMEAEIQQELSKMEDYQWWASTSY